MFVYKKFRAAQFKNAIKRSCKNMLTAGMKAPQFTLADANGNMVAVYLAAEFGGFAVHLLQAK